MSNYEKIENDEYMHWLEAEEKLSWADIDLSEFNEIIYPAYLNFVDKQESNPSLKRYYRTFDQVVFNNIGLIVDSTQMLNEHYPDYISEDELCAEDNGLQLRVETNECALLIIAGNNIIHPCEGWHEKYWKMLDEFLRDSYKDNYDTYQQEIMNNIAKYRSANALAILEKTEKECNKLREDNYKLKKRLDDQPDEIYKEIIQRAQDAINQGDDIAAIKNALFTLLPDQYTSEIRRLHRQPDSRVNHFHEGSTCNQAETIHNHYEK